MIEFVDRLRTSAACRRYRSVSASTAAAMMMRSGWR
jgi:hypothetical protein